MVMISFDKRFIIIMPIIFYNNYLDILLAWIRRKSQSSSAGQIFWQSFSKDSIDNLSIIVLKDIGNIMMRSIRKTEYYGNLLLNNKSLSNYLSFLLKYLFFRKYILGVLYMNAIKITRKQ